MPPLKGSKKKPDSANARMGRMRNKDVHVPVSEWNYPHPNLYFRCGGFPAIGMQPAVLPLPCLDAAIRPLLLKRRPAGSMHGWRVR